MSSGYIYVGLLAVDTAKCQATRPDQHLCLPLVAKWKSPFSLRGTAEVR